MERTLTRTDVAVDLPVSPATPAAAALSHSLRRLVPLWRYAVYAMTMFAVLAAAATVRLEVQQLRKDLDRNARATREAQILNDRLHLEMDARRRVLAMEKTATRLDLGPSARIVQLEDVVR